MALGLSPQEIVDSNEFPLLVKNESWGRIFLEDIADVQNGFAFESSKFTKNLGMPLIRIRDIDHDETENFYSGDYSSDYVVRKGDILIGMDGDFNLALWKGDDGLLNQRVCRIIPKSPLYSRKFLVYCLPAFLNAINTKTSSVTVKHLSSNTIKKIPLPFPPIEEQHRIVAKIEELFSSLDKGIESLKAAKQQLRIYRQSVLKWAFEGRLGRTPNTTVPQTNWQWVQIKDIGKIETGTTPSKKKPEYYSNVYPFYKPSDLEAGANVQSSMDGLSELGMKEARYVPENTILVTCIGATIGKTGLIKKGGGFNQQLNAIIPNGHHSPRFLYYQTISPHFQEQIKKRASATTLPILSKKKFELLKMVICSIEEQLKVVAKIDNRLSVCDKLEESIKQGLGQAEALRQSILKKAFEGKLIL